MSDKPKVSPDTQALIDALQAIMSNRGTLSQRQEEAKREMEELHFPLAPPDKVPHRIPCIHPTGYKFTAVVAPSDRFAGGRWVNIEDEQWPTDDEMCESKHPIFCDGSGNWWGRRSRFRGDDYDPDTKLWLYDNVRLPILRQVGGELPVDYRLDMQDKVRAIRAAADDAIREMQANLTALGASPTEPSQAPPTHPDATTAPPKKKSA